MLFVVQNKLRFEVMINSSRMFLYFQRDAIILFVSFYKCLIFHYLFCLGEVNEKKEQNYRMDLLGKKSNLRLVIQMEADFQIMNLGAMMISMMLKSGQPRFIKRLSRCDCF